MHYSKHFATASSSFIFAIAFTSLATCAESIMTDVTIDGTNPFNGSEITVSDGSEGPTTVRIVQGGGVAGFDLRESSHLILDGGDVTFLSSLTDNSMFTIFSGSLSCSEPICQLIDYNTLINASGNSAIVLKGGFSGGEFGLSDNSTLTVFGTNLTMFDPDSNNEFTVQGTLLDGSELLTRVSTAQAAGQIILIEVPEPTGAILLLSSLPLLFLSMRYKHLHTRV